jgi:CubicO group peptidase (beta-lactamase class C family)
MVERANNISFGKYMQKYIWGPLGIKNMTFHLKERPDMLERLPEMTERLGGMSISLLQQTPPQNWVRDQISGGVRV